MVDGGQSERRRHERFKLRAMYTRVAVVTGAIVGDELNGHAYDVSKSGVRIELDEPLEIGAPTQLRLGLPGLHDEVRVTADVVWINDPQDDPGPRRMALRFSEFQTAEDWRRLHDYVARGLRSAA